MNKNLSRTTLGIASFIALTLTFASTGALAQKQAAKAKAEPQGKIIMAINEGGAANADAAETFLRYQEFTQVIEKAVGMPVSVVAVRDRNILKDALKRQAYGLLFARPNDVPAEAIRDFNYKPVVMATEPSQALFIVKKESPLKTIADVKGKSIVTPDAYSNMWRVANAMLRDSKITMTSEKVKAMRDQAAIGWSMENGFYDVGVVNSISGIGKTWEKKGGRVIARSPDLPNMPMIASPQLSDAQIAKIRAALLTLNTSESGKAILAKIGLSGLQEAPTQVFLDFLKWLGDLEEMKQ
jgi:phosphonate transport system substrate-binding protein